MILVAFSPFDVRYGFFVDDCWCGNCCWFHGPLLLQDLLSVRAGQKDLDTASGLTKD